jgi:hypothetical protein
MSQATRTSPVKVRNAWGSQAATPSESAPAVTVRKASDLRPRRRARPAEGCQRQEGAEERPEETRGNIQREAKKKERAKAIQRRGRKPPRGEGGPRRLVRRG